jgi:hypothetical protein
MFTIIKKYSVALLGLVALTASITTHSATQYLGAYNKHYTNHAEQLVQNAWTQIAQTTGISLQQCTQYVQYYNNSPSNHGYSDPNVSSETRTVFQEVCRDFQVAPDAYSLWQHDGVGIAATDGKNVYVDEHNFRKCSLNSQRFILGHELGHCQNNDPVYFGALHALAKNKNIELNEYPLSHATEFRADMTAMLKGPKYVQGAIEFFTQSVYEDRDYESSSHPAPSKRLQVARELEATYISHNGSMALA